MKQNLMVVALPLVASLQLDGHHLILNRVPDPLFSTNTVWWSGVCCSSHVSPTEQSGNCNRHSRPPPFHYFWVIHNQWAAHGVPGMGNGALKWLALSWEHVWHCLGCHTHSTHRVLHCSLKPCVNLFQYTCPYCSWPIVSWNHATYRSKQTKRDAVFTISLLSSNILMILRKSTPWVPWIFSMKTNTDFLDLEAENEVKHKRFELKGPTQQYTR